MSPARMAGPNRWKRVVVDIAPVTPLARRLPQWERVVALRTRPARRKAGE